MYTKHDRFAGNICEYTYTFPVNRSCTITYEHPPFTKSAPNVLGLIKYGGTRPRETSKRSVQWRPCNRPIFTSNVNALTASISTASRIQRGYRREQLFYTNGGNDNYISLDYDGGGATGAHRWSVMTNANVDSGLLARTRTAMSTNDNVTSTKNTKPPENTNRVLRLDERAQCFDGHNIFVQRQRKTRRARTRRRTILGGDNANTQCCRFSREKQRNTPTGRYATSRGISYTRGHITNITIPHTK